MEYLVASLWQKANGETGYNNSFITTDGPLAKRHINDVKEYIKKINNAAEVIILNAIPLAEEVQHES